MDLGRARRAAAGIPATLRFREKWRIALAQLRAVLKAGFTLRGVVVDADYGANAAFRAGLERLGLAYGVTIRGEATFAIAAVRHGPSCRSSGWVREIMGLLYVNHPGFVGEQLM